MLRWISTFPRLCRKNPTSQHAYLRLEWPKRQTSTRAKLGSETLISKLPNGLTVASENTPSHFAAVGLYVDAGARFETDETAGVSHFLDRMAFKSTQGYETTDLVKTLESLGGNITAHSTRESIMYQAAVFNRDLARTLEIYGQVIGKPLFRDAEIEETKEGTLFEIDQLMRRPEAFLPELMHAVAFNDAKGNMVGNTLGRSLICPVDRLTLMNSDVLQKYRSLWFTPNRMVVSGIGVPHDSFVKLVEQYLGALPIASHDTLKQQQIQTLSPVYTGGIKVIDTSNEPILDPTLPQLTHVHIAFESPSSLSTDVYPLAILNSMMGGGGSFSAGGPGKGMYTRLYTRVLNRHYWVEQCNMFNYSYTETGLFGISAAVAGGHEAARAVVNVLCSELVAMTQSFTQTELDRAKNQLKSSLMMGLESRVVDCEDLGRQIAILGRRVGVQEVCGRIDAVTKDDVLNLARKVVFGIDDKPEMNFYDEDGASFKPWKRHGPWNPTVLVYGPIGDKFNESNVKDILDQFGLTKGSFKAALTRNWHSWRK